MGSSGDNVFIRSTGEGEKILYHLINAVSFKIVDMIFSTSEEAKSYAIKHDLKIIEYAE